MIQLYKIYLLLLIVSTGCFSCQSLTVRDLNARTERNCNSSTTIRLISDNQAPVDELIKSAPDLYIYSFKSGNFFLYRWRCDGFYHFTLSGMGLQGGNKLFLHDSIPFDEYIRDSIGLINKDLTEDLLIEGRRTKGRLQENYAILYCNEGNKKFIPIENIAAIPNPRFSFKGVTGWEVTDSGKLQYNYEWKDRFSLEIRDTILVSH